jgi:hypothetical protein
MTTRGSISPDVADDSNAIFGLGIEETDVIGDLPADSIGTAEIADDAVTAAKVADAAIDSSDKVVAGVLRATDMKVFVSTEQTGTGAEQDIAHGLGAVPTKVFAAAQNVGAAEAYALAYGTHDATNVKMTVTADVEFIVFAWV